MYMYMYMCVCGCVCVCIHMPQADLVAHLLCCGGLARAAELVVRSRD
jgi:hypothetical protein